MNRYHLLYFCVLLLMPVVDTALREHFGAAYTEYARRTMRFVPFVI